MKNKKIIFKIILTLSLCTLFDNAYGMMRRIVPSVGPKIQQRFFNPGQKFAQYTQNHKKKIFVGAVIAGFTAAAWHSQTKKALGISSTTGQLPQFKTSKEQEFEESINHYVQLKEPHETKEDVVHDIKSGSKLLNYPSDVSLLPPLYDYGRSQEPLGLQLQDMQKTFDALKIMMGIPEEVKIMVARDQAVTPNALMGYNPLDRVVFVYPLVLDDSCRSLQLFTLIHELTHAQQHMHMGLLGSHLHSNIENEHEADSQAAQVIKCPMCMKAVEADYLVHLTPMPKEFIMGLREQGYLIAEDITKYKNTKSAQDLCDFHKADTPVKKQLQSASPEEVFHIDYKNGSLFDRLSTVRF